MIKTTVKKAPLLPKTSHGKLQQKVFNLSDPDLFVYCCDFSSNAINLVKEHPDYNTDRCHAFVCDVTDEAFAFPFPDESLDIIILIFVLSAIHPDKMQDVIHRLSKLLKPGGLILFRDYGRFDMAQLRFKKGKCLLDNFYVRGDGTRVYFFTQGRVDIEVFCNCNSAKCVASLFQGR
ncbi:hypothetical protein ACROYT_G024292 [Oculina patagonica]